MKKTMLLMAVIMGTAVLGQAQIARTETNGHIIDTVMEGTGINSPESVEPWTLFFTIEGYMVGLFDVGFRVPNGQVVSSVSPPIGATCTTQWQWTLPSIQTSGTNCPVDMPQVRYELVVALHTGGNGNWHLADVFNAHQVSPGCCALPPPTNCTGIYHPGILSGQDCH